MKLQVQNMVVKNNPNKFPERFSWVLDDNELNILRSKFLTANVSRMSRKNPRVFKEQGVAMLATILKTDIATETSINLINDHDTYKSFLDKINEILKRKLKVKKVSY